MFKAIYYRNLYIDKAERIQDEFKARLDLLKKCNRRNPNYVTARKNLLTNAENLYDGKQMIIDAFKNKIFMFGVEEPEDSGKRPDESDEDEDENKFYTPKEVTPRSETPDFGIRKMFKNEEETLNDMPDLES